MIDRLVKAIAIMDRNGRANEEYNFHMLWNEDWKFLRENIRVALNTLKRIEINQKEKNKWQKH